MLEIEIAKVDGPYPIVARKLNLALEQFNKSEEIEELQQIGIVIRDSWIDFTQKIFTNKLDPTSFDLSPVDVKGMLKKMDFPESVVGMANDIFQLSLVIQHDRNIKKPIVGFCLANTVVCMQTLHELSLQRYGKDRRTYYKCPNCGSLKLETIIKKQAEIDGSLTIEHYKCPKCKWDEEKIIG